MEKQSLVVPLHGSAIAAPDAPPAHLSYGNGHLLTSVQVYTIFWGAAWQQPANSTLMNQMNQGFDAILTSSLMDTLAEYSVPGQSIGHGTRIGSAAITTTEPGTGSGQVTDAQVQQALRAWIAQGSIPGPNANTLYFVYLPPGVIAIDPSGDASCQQLCGYHWYIAGTNPEVYYAVMPFPGCQGCVAGLTVLQALTSISSHELCEAVTDAQPWTGWNDSANGEIGDICAWQTATVNGYTVQKEWSNKANACVAQPPAPQHASRWANQGTPPSVGLSDSVGVLTVMDTPSAAQRPYAFMWASDGNLWVNWWDGRAWHWANQGTPPSVGLSGPVGVLTVMDTPSAAQRPQAFMRATDRNLWVNWWS